MMKLNNNDELQQYHLNRNDILLSSDSSFEIELFENKTHEPALDIFPNSLFNKKVVLSDNSFVGFMMEMTDAKILILGDYEQRYEIPKSKAVERDSNIRINLDWNEFASYRTNRI